MCFLPGFYYHFVPHPEDSSEHKNKLTKMAQTEQEEDFLEREIFSAGQKNIPEEEEDVDNTDPLGLSGICGSFV